MERAKRYWNAEGVWNARRANGTPQALACSLAPLERPKGYWNSRRLWNARSAIGTPQAIGTRLSAFPLTLKCVNFVNFVNFL